MSGQSSGLAVPGGYTGGDPTEILCINRLSCISYLTLEKLIVLDHNESPMGRVGDRESYVQTPVDVGFRSGW